MTFEASSGHEAGKAKDVRKEERETNETRERN